MTRDDIVEAGAKAVYEHSETNEAGDTRLCGFFSDGDLAAHQAEVALTAMLPLIKAALVERINEKSSWFKPDTGSLPQGMRYAITTIEEWTP